MSPTSTQPAPPRRSVQAGAARPSPTAPLAAKSPYAPGLALRTTPAWHLARRACLAPTAATAAEIARVGTARWIEQQLTPSAIDDGACERVLDAALPWSVRTAAQINADPRAGGRYWEGAPHLSEALVVRPVLTRRQLLETMVDALSDHVYVAAAGRGELGCTDHDLAVLRPYVLGRYADLLQAALTHVGLLRYLNNEVSSADNLNENLGRELLELYTVGSGVYTQADVRDSARILTGHSLDWGTLGYAYRPAMHSTGPVTVMGFTHANASAADGPAVLRAYTTYLARHRRTAQRLCRRLAIRFVTDTPTDAFVDELVGVYLAADTNLAPVMRRLLNHATFIASAGATLTRPLERVVTAVRAAAPTTYTPDVDPIASPWDHSTAYFLAAAGGQEPRHWPAVNGFPLTSDRWTSTMTSLSTWNGAADLVDPWNPRFARPDWISVLGVAVGQNAWDAARRISTQLTGWTWPDADVSVIASYLAAHTSAPVATTATLNADALRWRLPSVVRMVLASPYARIR